MCHLFFFFLNVATTVKSIIEKCRRGQLIDMVNNIKRDHAIERMIECARLSRKHNDRFSAKMT